MARIELWLRSRLGYRAIRLANRLLQLKPSDGPDGPCLYCGVEGDSLGGYDHAADCPLTTGVFPVELKDMWPDGPAKCEGCDVLLWPGDTYSLIPFDGMLQGVLGGTVACSGCALLAQITKER